MKKRMALLLAVAMCFGPAACNLPEDAGRSAADESPDVLIDDGTEMRDVKYGTVTYDGSDQEADQ